MCVCLCAFVRMCVCVCVGSGMCAGDACMAGRLIQQRVEWRVAADVIFARLMSLMESGAYLAGATQFAGCD